MTEQTYGQDGLSLPPEDYTDTPLTAGQAVTGLVALGYDQNLARLAVDGAQSPGWTDDDPGGFTLRHHRVDFTAEDGYVITRLYTTDQLRGGAISIRVLTDAQEEATRAHRKHGEHSMMGDRYTSPDRLSILTEEAGETADAVLAQAIEMTLACAQITGAVGRVARELNEDMLDGQRGPGVGEGRPEHLYKELIQVAAMALTWAERIRRRQDGQDIS